MTNEQREIHRKKRVLEHAERLGNIYKTCRYFGVARSTSYLWRARYRELGEINRTYLLDPIGTLFARRNETAQL